MPAKFVPNRALADELANQFSGLIEQGGFVAVRETKRRTPVGETGNLRNGFHADVERTHGHVRVTIGNNVYYAPYVEFGTSKMRGRHMLANGTAAAARWLAKRGFKVEFEIYK